MNENETIKEKVENFRIETLEKSVKRTNALSTASGIVATVSTIIVAMNLADRNLLPSLQTGGATVAMIGYFIGYCQEKPLIEKELELTKEQKCKEITPKKRLELLKVQLERLEITKNTSILAMIGFSTSSLASLIALMIEQGDTYALKNFIGMCLSTIVAALSGVLYKSTKKHMEYKESDVKGTEYIIELDELSAQPIDELAEDQSIIEEPVQELKKTK